MVGFAGRIYLEGDTDEAKSLVGDSLKLAETLRAWKTTQRINNVTKAFHLRDGSYVVISDLQHMRAMCIVAPVSGGRLFEDYPSELFVEDVTGVTDTVGGIVTSPHIVQETVAVETADGVEYADVDVVNAFTPCDYTLDRYTTTECRRRLAVIEDVAFQPLQNPFELVFTEHAHCKPANYSGAMRPLVQFLLGLGKVIRPTWEERWMKENERGYLTMSDDSPNSDVPSAMRSGFGLYFREPDVVTLKYDYRFGKTHGITFDKDDVPWVIQISAQGVYAMRLYLDPLSTTTAGRTRYLAIAPELEEFIDLFGGVPLCVPYPGTTEFAKWERAGEVVKLMNATEIGDFYSKGAFSSDIGWTFNSRGTQAHNCCVGALNNLSTGHHYRLDIDLTRETLPVLSGNRAELAGYFVELYEKNKCRRMSEMVAGSILTTMKQDPEAGRAAFDAAVVAPTLIGDVTLVEVSSGTLYNPARFPYQPQIKFPESLYGGLVSFDFGPHEIGAGTDFCDGPMFVCLIDDEVEVVRYALDTRARATPVFENTRQQCQFTGQWQHISYGGAPAINGHFYSSRWDWREEITPDDSVTTYTGSKVGVTGYADTYAFFSMCIGVSSKTWFSVKSKSRSREGRGKNIAVAIPFNDRNCYYMAQHNYIAGVSESEGLHFESTPGPQHQLWMLYNFVWHWVGFCGGIQNINAGSVGCIAKKFGEWTAESCVADPIPAEIQYSVCPPTAYPNDPAITVYAPLWGNSVIGSASFGAVNFPSTYTRTTKVSEPAQSFEIRMINDSGFGEVITKSKSMAGTDPGTGDPVDFYSLTMDPWWFRASPTEEGDMPYMASTYSCLGSPVTNYHKDMDMSVGSIGTPENMHSAPTACFTGVIR